VHFAAVFNGSKHGSILQFNRENYKAYKNSAKIIQKFTVRPGGEGDRTFAPESLIVTYKLHESCCNLVNIAEAIYIRRNIRFYRATSMHSADYAVARCLSVCRYSVDTAEHILNFLPPENPTIIVFLYQTVCIRRPC